MCSLVKHSQRDAVTIVQQVMRFINPPLLTKVNIFILIQAIVRVNTFDFPGSENGEV